mgnify:CR=1 FL=1
MDFLWDTLQFFKTLCKNLFERARIFLTLFHGSREVLELIFRDWTLNQIMLQLFLTHFEILFGDLSEIKGSDFDLMHVFSWSWLAVGLGDWSHENLSLWQRWHLHNLLLDLINFLLLTQVKISDLSKKLSFRSKIFWIKNLRLLLIVWTREKDWVFETERTRFWNKSLKSLIIEVAIFLELLNSCWNDLWRTWIARDLETACKLLFLFFRLSTDV